MQIIIPEDLLTRLSQLAARQQQSVETILSDRLFTALDDELDSLKIIKSSDIR